jgi:hypothetical protein
VVEDVTVAEVEDWAGGLEKVLERIGPRFARSEPRARAGVYLRGLLSAAERKNGWTLSERAGDRTPDAMQRLWFPRDRGGLPPNTQAVSSRTGVRSGRSTRVSLSNTAIGDSVTITRALRQ